MVDYRTLVIGASVNPDRYSHKVVLKLLDSGIKVIPMGINQGNIADLVIVRPFEKQKNIHTVLIYITPEVQKEYYKYIINLQPKRVFFNPGTENPIFSQMLQKHNIYWENSCSLVLLSTNQYQS